MTFHRHDAPFGADKHERTHRKVLTFIADALVGIAYFMVLFLLASVVEGATYETADGTLTIYEPEEIRCVDAGVFPKPQDFFDFIDGQLVGIGEWLQVGEYYGHQTHVVHLGSYGLATYIFDKEDGICLVASYYTGVIA